jgi:hypothetical protein
MPAPEERHATFRLKNRMCESRRQPSESTAGPFERLMQRKPKGRQKFPGAGSAGPSQSGNR